MSAPHVLVVDDEDDIRGLIDEILSEEGYKVTVAADAAAARKAASSEKLDLILLDIWMPDTDGISLLREWSDQGGLQCPVVMMSGHGTVDTAVEATRLGALDFVEKPLSLAKLLRTVERALEGAKKHGRSLRSLLPALMAPVGRSRVMQDLRDKVQRFANHDSSVLLVGEPGTGRGAFASYIHGLSSRSEAPLITLPAASLTDSNCEEQLFGSESDGNIHSGYLERAGSGTLVIDELMDLNMQSQKLLISAFDQGQFIRSGGHESVPVRSRILATVGANYEAEITHGNLRRELVALLSLLTANVPPLREYAEDVPELLAYYVDKLVEKENLPFRRFSVASQNRLRNYPWPDNVRELKNLVRRLLLTGSEEEITLNEIEQEVSSDSEMSGPLVKQDLLSLPLREAREHFERAYLQQQLVLCEGKVGKLAKRVGMERTHLYRKLRSLGVDFRSVSASDD